MVNVRHFISFGSKCYIKREDKKIRKFYSQVDEGIFIGYSSKRKYYKCYNLRLDKVLIESINVKIDELKLTSSREDSEESDDEEEEGSNQKEVKKINVE